MLVKEIATYLQSKGLGTLDTSIFYEFLPPNPNQCLVVFNTGGDVSSSKLPMDYPSIQIRVRALTVTAAYNLIAAAYYELQGLRNVTLSEGTKITSIQAAQSSPINIGRDEQNRQEYTQNYDLIVRNVTINRD